ncbi:TonB-dependent receptor [Sphingobium sp. YR657]|uniref:TonB-dependent receptor domain-containing protein n=1 Tax=Sphingobium sp. YR657 TaxID=1884366 RepID=UPI0031381AEA
MKSSLNMGGSLFAIMLSMSAGAQAQDASTAAAPPAQGTAEAPEAPSTADIVVTGTSIRGVAPVGSSIVSVSRMDIDASPSVTTAQLLQETPQVFNFGVSDSSRNGTGGAGNISGGTSINLRGLGPYATLTLINGRRPVPSGTTASFIDPSTIPTIALERVEIVPDGASAIYGSDAVAGVANLILRRNVEGLSAQGRIGFGDGYRDAQLSLIGGHKWDSGQITIAYQHSFRSNISGLDRSYYRSDLTGRGGSDYRVTQCAPGNIVTGGRSYAIPAGGATSTNLVPGTVNRCDNAQYNDILPQQTFDSASLTFNQDITDNLSMFVDAYASSRRLKRDRATLAQNLTVPRSNAFFVSPAGTSPASETVQYSFANDFGPTREETAFSRAWQVFAGLDWNFGNDLKLSGYGSYGWNKDQSTGRSNINTALLTTALASSNPATAFDPFGQGRTSRAIIDAIGNYVVVTPGRATQKSAELKLDGPIFALPGGDVRFAIGASYVDLSLVTGQYRGVPGALTGYQRDLGRKVKAAYAELLVPIIGPDNAIPGIEKLDLDLAGRIEDYSDVGSTTNPKIGINWTPTPGIVVHGSFGTSFRAPTLTQLRSAGGSQIYLQNYSDPTANGGAGGIIQGVAINGDNLDLVPETATTWSLGVDFVPAAVPGLRASFNYFNIKYEGQITGVLANLNVLQQEQAYAAVITRNPTQAFLQELVNSGRTINNGTAANVLATTLFVDGRNNNLGVTKTNGIDFDITYALNTDGAGTFRFGLKGTRYLKFDVALTPTAPIVDRVNTIDYPLKLRGRASFNWTQGGLSAGGFFNYANSYLNNQTNPARKVKAFSTLDLNLSYRISDPAWRNLKIGVEATNVFDRDPPFVNIAPTNNGGGGFDPQNASPLGRVLALTVGFDL